MNKEDSQELKFRYRPDIDGLRAIAVISVIFFHVFPDFIPGGFIGVDIFFVISGFLITNVLLLSLSTNKPFLVKFYSNRIRRIFPALIILLLACYFFGHYFLLPDEQKQLGKWIAAGSIFVSNLVLWSAAGYFDTSANVKPLLHLWSLGIEEQFYIIWPIALYVIVKNKFKIIISILGLCAISFIINIWYAQHDLVGDFYSPQSRVWELLVGSLCSVVTLYSGHKLRFLEGSIWNKIWNSICHLKYLQITGFIILLYGVFAIDGKTSFPGVYALIPVIGAFLIILNRDGVVNKILSHPMLVWIGLISYPLYLFHWPILVFAKIISGGEGQLSFQFRLFLILFSLILAYLTYILIERPIRQSTRGVVLDLVLVIALIVIGALGLHRYFTQTTSDINQKQLTYEFPNTPECLKEYPFAIGSCYKSEKLYDKSILIVGDSHMEALTYGFIKLFNEGSLKYNLIAIGKGGCNPFLNTESYDFNNKSQGCLGIVSGALVEALDRKDIEWIILVGRYASRYHGTLFGEIEEDSNMKPWSYDFRLNGYKTSNNYEAFEMGLGYTVKELKSKKIIFVHQVPELGFDPRNCLQRFNREWGGKSCSISRGEVLARLGPYKASVNRISGKYSNMIQYDPIWLYCNNVECTPFDDQKILLYRDDDHMSANGAVTIAKDIFKKILEGSQNDSNTIK